MKNGAIAGHLMGMRKAGKLVKPSLRVNASMEAPYPGETSKKYDKEEISRLKSEIVGIRDALANWDVEDVAKRARRSIESELTIKEARLIGAEARYGDMYDSDSGDKKKGKPSKSKADTYDEEDEPEEEE